MMTEAMYVSRILPEVRRYGLQAGHLNPMSWCLTCNNRVVMTIPTSKVVVKIKSYCRDKYFPNYNAPKKQRQ